MKDSAITEIGSHTGGCYIYELNFKSGCGVQEIYDKGNRSGSDKVVKLDKGHVIVGVYGGYDRSYGGVILNLGFITMKN